MNLAGVAPVFIISSPEDKEKSSTIYLVTRGIVINEDIVGITLMVECAVVVVTVSIRLRLKLRSA